MGARPLRRVIEQYLEDPLAEQLLLHPGKGGSWHVSANEEKLTFAESEPSEEHEHAAELTGPPA